MRSPRIRITALALGALLTACAAGGRAETRPPAPAAANTTHTLRHDGRERSFVVHLPPALRSGTAPQGQTFPLVLVFHGGGGNAANAERMTGFSRLADREGFIVVYPNGSGRFADRLLTWNAGGIPVWAQEHDIDDVGFVRAMVSDLDRRFPVDTKRIYAAGMSNGGMMVHRLAREASDVFAAVCDVAGAMNYQDRDPKHPVGVMIVHGLADRNVLFHGGRPQKSIGPAGERVDTSVGAAVKYYVTHNGLRDEPTTTETEGTVTTTTYRRTTAGHEADFDVTLVAIQGEGHTWPGGRRGSRRGDTPTDAFDATAAAWAFFEQHVR